MKELKGFEEKMWDYLCKKLKVLNDDNKTAREIFNYVDRNTKIQIGIDRIIVANENRRKI